MPRKEEREGEVTLPEKPLRRFRDLEFYERIWRLVTFIVVPFSLYLIIDVQAFEEWKKNNLSEYATWSDLWLAGVSCVVLFFIRKGWERFWYDKVYVTIEDKHQGEERVERTKRVVKWMYDFFYYGGVTGFAYLTFGRSAHFIPPLLFGTGDCSTLYEYYPALPPVPYLKQYYLIQLGSHLCSVLEQILFKRKDLKFYEYFLHHYMAFVLIFYSYMLHVWSLGTTVLMTHDISDIFLSFARAYEAQKVFRPAKVITYILLGTTASAWAYLRTFVFPACCIYVSYFLLGTPGMDPWEKTGRILTFEFSLMCVLLVMNAYWVIILVSMLVKSLKKGAYTNVYDQKILQKEKAK